MCVWCVCVCVCVWHLTQAHLKKLSSWAHFQSWESRCGFADPLFCVHAQQHRDVESQTSPQWSPVTAANGYKKIFIVSSACLQTKVLVSCLFLFTQLSQMKWNTSGDGNLLSSLINADASAVHNVNRISFLGNSFQKLICWQNNVTKRLRSKRLAVSYLRLSHTHHHLHLYPIL